MPGYPRVGEQFGRYRITGEIGAGGMGVVLGAVLDGLDRKVALKILSQDLADDPAFRQRFHREAEALASLYSPHIVDIYDHGEQDGALFIATRLVEGLDLESRLARDGALAPGPALGLVAQVASAVADAHAAGVIHRDIKPSNVLLHESSHGDRFAYLCDFGIAYKADEEHTRTGGVIGTVAYLAPERHLGADATVASDIYALGCLLWATLTGRPPYRGTDLQIAMQHTSDPIPQYAGAGPVADAINAVLRRSLAKEPEDRYPSAGHMRAALLKAQQLATREPLLEGDTPVDPGESYSPTRRIAPAGPPRRRALSRWLPVAVVVLVMASAAAFAVRAWTQAPAGPDSGDDGATTERPVTCWDGVEAATPADCTPPQGLAGLRWVFPSLDQAFDSCLLQEEKPDRAQTWFCLVPGGEDGDGIRYIEWTSTQAARAFFTDQTAESPAAFVQGLTHLLSWYEDDDETGGMRQVTITYRNRPFSATLFAQSIDGLRELCAVVKLRSLNSFGELSPRCPGRGSLLTTEP